MSLDASSSRSGLLAAVSTDLHRLHRAWMELAFPRQLDAERTALGRWTPTTPRERAAFGAWSALGALAVAAGYPLLLLGVVVRFYARRLDGAAARLGVLGVVLVSLVAWGGLTALARLRFSADGFLAVLAASVVATASAVLAVLFARVGGRTTTVALAYPFGTTAVFLPPVVAALYSPALAGVVFPGSRTLAVWLLDNVLAVGGLASYLRATYDLTEAAYVLMWFAIAVPVGWLLGLVVTLANVVRPGDRRAAAGPGRR